jgi:hypothetical protein
MENKLLLHVGESVSLTGLGVLLFPVAAVPELNRFELHTALRLLVRWPSGLEEEAIATVEEVSRPGATEAAPLVLERVLLLTHEGASALPTGTEVWWTEEEAGW